MTLSNLTDGIAARITNALATGASAASMKGATVLTEDAKDLATKVSTALDSAVGMLILIGEPTFDQTATEFSPTATARITLAIAVGENPTLWRTVAGRPKAKDATLILTGLLHNLKLPGFTNLKVVHSRFVPDKKRQLFELTVTTATTVPQLPTP